MKLSSPHDLESYPPLVLFDKSSQTIIKVSQRGDSDDHTIKSEVPWHVINNANFLIDLESLDDKSYCSVDAWRWSLIKTYVVSSPSLENIPTRKYDNIDHFRVVKRNYKYLQDGSLLKTITSLCTLGSPCTDRISPLKTSHGKAMIQYRFLNGNKMIEPSESTRIYPSVRLRLKRQLENK